MEVREVPISSIEEWTDNPRRQRDEGDIQYESLKTSLERWDVLEPIVWNERTGQIVAGHQRVQVLEDKGRDLVPATVVDLNYNEQRALSLALNKIDGSWDEDKLESVLEDVAEESTVQYLGFDEQELDDRLSEYDEPTTFTEDVDTETHTVHLTMTEDQKATLQAAFNQLGASRSRGDKLHTLTTQYAQAN